MGSGTDRQTSNSAVILSVLVFVLLIATISVLTDRVAKSPRFLVSNLRIEVSAADDPVLQYASSALGGVSLLGEPRSIVDPELAALALEALASSPWVKRVAGVDRHFPDSVNLRVEIREPLGVVLAGPERLAVDENAIVVEHDTSLGPPLIPNIRTPGAPLKRVPVDGQAFGREDGPRSAVSEAVSVLRTLKERNRHPALGTLRIIEVSVGVSGQSRRPGASDIVVILDSKVEILWGRSPMSPEFSLEPKPEQKLDNLSRVLTTFPGLLGVSRIDLSLADPDVTPAKG